MNKMTKILKKLCLGIGVISLLGLASVPAYALTDEEWAEEHLKDLSYDTVLNNGPLKVPQNGDSETLNVGWTNADAGTYYCKDESRVKVTGWQQIDGKWYYFDSSTCDMKTGWFNDGGTWYYLIEPSYLDEGKVKIKYGLGSMATGWLNDNGTWYYLNANGSMAANTTINGYILGPSGAWIQ